MNKSPVQAILDEITETENLFDQGNTSQQHFFRFLSYIALEENDEIYTNPEHKSYKECTDEEIFLDILENVPKESYNLFVGASHTLLLEDTNFKKALCKWLKVLPNQVSLDIVMYKPPIKKPEKNDNQHVQKQKDTPSNTNSVQKISDPIPNQKENNKSRQSYPTLRKRFSPRDKKNKKHSSFPPHKHKTPKQKSRPNSPTKGLNGLKESITKIFKKGETQQDGEKSVNEKKVSFHNGN